MNCRTIQEMLPDVALGVTPAPPEIDRHLGECAQCSETLEALRATMNLLDEWTAPEPSQYWDVRMQARLREEQQSAAPAGWLKWLRRPALTVAAALVLVAGVGTTYVARFMHQQQQENAAVPQQVRGTAVSDLQYLEKNSDLLQNFDALDDLDGYSDDDSNN